MLKQIEQPATQAVPDPSDCYERSHPEHEAGQGRLDNNTKATPTARADKTAATVTNAHADAKQVNAQEAASRPKQVDQSRMDGEPLGWEKTAEK